MTDVMTSIPLLPTEELTNPKKRQRAEQPNDLVLVDALPPPTKSPKLLEDSVPGVDTAVVAVPIPEDLPLKYPYTVTAVKREDFEPVTEIRFVMPTSDIEFMKRKVPVSNEEENDEEDDGKENPWLNDDKKFVFNHFHQFELDPNEDDEESNDRGGADDEKDDPELQALIRNVRAKYYATKIATSVHSAEDKWFQANGVLKADMQLSTALCKANQVHVYLDHEQTYRIAVSVSHRKPLTTHGYFCAVEQVLRQPAPMALRELLKPMLREARHNCHDQRQRYKYIMNPANKDVLIGDLITFDFNGQWNVPVRDVLKIPKYAVSGEIEVVRLDEHEMEAYDVNDEPSANNSPADSDDEN